MLEIHGLSHCVCSHSSQDALSRLSYLLEVHSFTEEEMDVNKVTLLWPKSLDPIFDENEKVSCMCAVVFVVCVLYVLTSYVCTYVCMYPVHWMY